MVVTGVSAMIIMACNGYMLLYIELLTILTAIFVYFPLRSAGDGTAANCSICRMLSPEFLRTFIHGSKPPVLVIRMPTPQSTGRWDEC